MSRTKQNALFLGVMKTDAIANDRFAVYYCICYCFRWRQFFLFVQTVILLLLLVVVVVVVVVILLLHVLLRSSSHSVFTWPLLERDMHFLLNEHASIFVFTICRTHITNIGKNQTFLLMRCFNLSVIKKPA